MSDEVGQIKVALSDTVRRVGDLEADRDEMRQQIAKMDRDIGEIRTLLGQTATKADVTNMGAALSSKIDGAITGILSQALGAMPAKQANVFTAISAIVLIIGLVLTIVGFHRMAP